MQLHERLNWVYKTAQQVTEKENQRHKWNYNHKIRCTHLGVCDKVLLKRTAFIGKYKIQDHCEVTIYCVEGQPYAGLLAFKIVPVAGESKMKIMHKTCYSHFKATLRGAENKTIWQDAEKSQDFILAISDDGVQGTEVV